MWHNEIELASSIYGEVRIATSCRSKGKSFLSLFGCHSILAVNNVFFVITAVNLKRVDCCAVFRCILVFEIQIAPKFQATSIFWGASLEFECLLGFYRFLVGEFSGFRVWKLYST